MGMVLKRCRYVVKSFKPFQIAEFADIVINNGVVTCVGNCAYSQEFNVLECDDSIAMPGLVSMHTHALPEKDYADNSINVVKMVLEQLIRYGYTAIHIVDVDADMLEDACRIAMKIGVRISIGPIITSSKDLNKLSHLKHFKKNLYCIPSINIPSAEDVDANILTAVKEFVSTYNPSIHIHITSSESIAKTLSYYRRVGSWPITALDNLGLLTKNTCIAHASWITTWEIERIRERGSCIALAPFADAMKGVHGVAHPALFDIEKICIGIDNPWHRPSPSILLDIISLQAVYSSKTWGIYPDIQQILHYATALGYSVMGIEAGVIEPGKRADIAVLHANQHDLDKSLGGFLFRGLSNYTKYTIIEGKLVWKYLHSM